MELAKAPCLEYVPCNRQTGELLQSHKADFCLALEPEETPTKFTSEQDLVTISLHSSVVSMSPASCPRRFLILPLYYDAVNAF